MAARRLLPLFVALSIGVVACGQGGTPTQVAAGGDPAATSTTASTTEAPTTSVPTTPTSSTSIPATTPTSSTTTVASAADPAPADPAADPGASPVAGLDAAQLQAAVEAPQGGAARSLGGVTLDQVTLDDGTHVWRVRIPGTFTARSARVSLSVGSRVVGTGVLARDLGSITAITTDGTGLTAGQPVTYQWEGGPVVAAGRLAVGR